MSAQRHNEASQIVRDSEYVKALVAAARDLGPLLGGWREVICEIEDLGPKDEAIGRAMWAALDQIDRSRTALRAALRPFIPAARVEENGRA